MFEKNLPDYIISSVVYSENVNDKSIDCFLEEYKARKLKAKTIRDVKPENLRKLLSVLKETNLKDYFDFPKIKLTAEEYFGYLELIMLKSYYDSDKDLHSFFERVATESKDAYAKLILKFIELKQSAKTGNYLNIQRISSLRKIELVEAFYTLPVYSLENRIKIAKQMHMKGHLTNEKYTVFGNSIEDMFKSPLFQAYYHLSTLLSKQEDITDALLGYLESYPNLEIYEKSEIDEFVGFDDIKKHIFVKMDQKSQKAFALAWESLISSKERMAKMVEELDTVKEAFLQNFIEKYSKNGSVKEMFNASVNLTTANAETYAFVKKDAESLLQTSSMCINKKKDALSISIQPIRSIIEPVFDVLVSSPLAITSDEVRTDFLEFISGLELSPENIAGVRNNIHNSDLLDKLMYIKVMAGNYPKEIVLNYASVVPFELLESMPYLFSNPEGIIGAVNFDIKEQILALKKIVPLLKDINPEACVDLIEKRYREYDSEGYNDLLMVSKSNKRAIEHILNV